MAGIEPVEMGGGIAILDLGQDSAAQARLIWADELFSAEFDRALVDSPVFGTDMDRQLIAALESLAQGAVATLDVPSTSIFGRPVAGRLALVGLGNRRALLGLPTDPETEGQKSDSQLAEMLDAVPLAATVIDARDGTILWLNETFRELLDGSEFDLVGTSLADHFALPGMFSTLMSATGAIAPSTPVPTPLKTLSGLMTPVVATAKRLRFRGRDAALVCLVNGY